jgi:hypothetical protein
MFKTHLRKLVPITLSLILILALTSCNKASDIVNSTTETAIPVTEYKTIPPPEDGWTLELLNEVLYIRNYKVDFPFTLRDIGITSGKYDILYNENAEISGGGNIYKDDSDSYVFISTKALNKHTFDYDYPVNYIHSYAFYDDNGEISSEIVDYITINGLKIGSNEEDVIRALGKNYDKSSFGYYYLFDDGSTFIDIHLYNNIVISIIIAKSVSQIPTITSN